MWVALKRAGCCVEWLNWFTVSLFAVDTTSKLHMSLGMIVSSSLACAQVDVFKV